MNKIKLVPFQGLPALSDEEEQVFVLSDKEQEDQLAEMQGGVRGARSRTSNSWSFIYFTLIFQQELKINLDVHSS